MGEGKMFLVVEERERSGKSSSATKADPRSRQTPRTTQPYRSAASRLRQSLRSLYPREDRSKRINSRALSESTTFDMNLTVCVVVCTDMTELRVEIRLLLLCHAPQKAIFAISYQAEKANFR